MTGVWEKMPTKPLPASLQLVKTVCDRCGKEATIRGVPRDERAWGQVRVFVQGEHGPDHADLCQSCSQWLCAQINEGARLLGGAGMQDDTARANEAWSGPGSYNRSPPPPKPQHRSGLRRLLRR